MGFVIFSENWEIKSGDEFVMCGSATGAG